MSETAAQKTELVNLDHRLPIRFEGGRLWRSWFLIWALPHTLNTVWCGLTGSIYCGIATHEIFCVVKLEIKRHSMASTTAYIDLLEKHLMEDVSGIKGAPTLRKRSGRQYWYDRYRVGDSVHESYLGEDSAQLRSFIEDHKANQEDAAARKERMAYLIRLMNADRFLRLDRTTGSLFSALSKAGFFRLGGVVVGTHAFRAYEGELGVRLDVELGAFTDDIDIAGFEHLSVAIAETDLANPSADEIFRGLEFKPVPSLASEHVWKWAQTKGDAVVEFLTPSFGSEEPTKRLPALGVSAKCLNHLNYLIRQPIDAVLNYRSGVLVKIPRPERYAIHKLIVSERRGQGPNPQKARKDRMQAEFLIHVLADDRPDELRWAYSEALNEGRGWRDRIDRALSKMPGARKVLLNLNQP
ncbi:MAG: GSU2403 family nucleotidyltransferase fold protein [Gammaproteobacteria bacterium]